MPLTYTLFVHNQCPVQGGQQGRSSCSPAVALELVCSMQGMVAQAWTCWDPARWLERTRRGRENTAHQALRPSEGSSPAQQCPAHTDTLPSSNSLPDTPLQPRSPRWPLHARPSLQWAPGVKSRCLPANGSLGTQLGSVRTPFSG